MQKVVRFFSEDCSPCSLVQQVCQLAVVDTNFLHKGTRSFKLLLFLEEIDKYLKRAVNLIWRRANSGAAYLLTMKAEWTTGLQQRAMFQTAKHEVNLACVPLCTQVIQKGQRGECSHPGFCTQARTTWRQATIQLCKEASSQHFLVKLLCLWKEIQNPAKRQLYKNRELNLWFAQINKNLIFKEGSDRWILAIKMLFFGVNYIPCTG